MRYNTIYSPSRRAVRYIRCRLFTLAHCCVPNDNKMDTWELANKLDYVVLMECSSDLCCHALRQKQLRQYTYTVYLRPTEAKAVLFSADLFSVNTITHETPLHRASMISRLS